MACAGNDQEKRAGRNKFGATRFIRADKESEREKERRDEKIALVSLARVRLKK